MFGKILLIALAVFFLLYGLFAVTNITVVWGPTLIGFAALVAGVICTIAAFTGRPTS